MTDDAGSAGPKSSVQYLLDWEPHELTFQDDGDGAVLVEDRLVSARHIDDREALYAKSNAVVRPDSARVRPSVLERRAHVLDCRAVDRSPEVDLAGYTAHVDSPCWA